MIFENDRKMKFERSKDMCPLKKEIISYLFDYVARKPRDQWWSYKGEFKYEGKTYNLECDCKYDNQMFTYKNLHIEHKQEVIDIEDMIAKGLIQ
jgi:hypothetical protein